MLSQIPAAVLWAWQASWPKRIFAAICVGISLLTIVYGIFATVWVWLLSGIANQLKDPLDMIHLCYVCLLGIICILATSILVITMFVGYYTVRWALRSVFNIIVEIVTPVRKRRTAEAFHTDCIAVRYLLF
jgi:hypothetical protein